jgi:hypothetical protein
MIKHGYTIGIDLISVGEVDSIYGIYESVDCAEWKMVASSKIISDLIQFAKITYHTDTPMIMPEQITQLLKYEFIAKREQKLIDKCSRKLVNKKIGWFGRLFRFFKTGESNE